MYYDDALYKFTFYLLTSHPTDSIKALSNLIIVIHIKNIMKGSVKELNKFHNMKLRKFL